ncbi:hypothetical protein GCM10011374_34620 [Kocuria dechangensis]|uniref:DUF1304 domain-containing protein n=1 Tax=Kocuria dechangensis TaxID=1176249 RepID=A0A917H479_9MICC|nr:DUF1304 family protein [Kocuria dechangensis]GGG67431.1 hypothetical protein GCM10011374_34620 [Kocuria dechangensis]
MTVKTIEPIGVRVSTSPPGGPDTSPPPYLGRRACRQGAGTNAVRIREAITPNLLSQIVAGLSILILRAVFVMDVFFFHPRELYKFTLIEPEDVGAVRTSAINVGFYNPTYALGLITGLILLRTVWVEAGQALVLFCCAAHVILGIVLYVSERRLWAGALLQSVPPAIVLVTYGTRE